MSNWDDLAFDGHGHLYDLGGEFSVETYGPPDPIRWVAVDDLGEVFGRRIAVPQRDQIIYDHRAASEVYESNGGRYVNVVAEAQWWQWSLTDEEERPDRISRAVPFPTRHVWVEIRSARTARTETP